MSRVQFYLLYLALGSGLLFGQYGGSFDQASCGTLSGWAWNGTDTPMNVDVYDGAVYVTSTLANQYRADLPGAGIGNGYHAFSLTTPSR